MFDSILSHVPYILKINKIKSKGSFVKSEK